MRTRSDRYTLVRRAKSLVRATALPAWSCLVAVLVLLLGAGAAQAASISYLLDQTNDPEGWLPDGTQNYVQVTIADGLGGDIDFTVDILGPLLGIADVTFGIQSFVFNSTNVLSAGDVIGEPAGWSVSTDYNPGPPHQTGDGFGRFEIELSGTGATRQSPTLSFSISVLGDSIFDYVEASTNSSQGTSYFAAFVAGIVDQDPEDPLDPIDVGNPGIGQCYDTDGMGNYTPGCNILNSIWVGGTQAAAAPEPGLALLLGAGLAGLLARRRRPRA